MPQTQEGAVAPGLATLWGEESDEEDLPYEVE